jgi:hypothetical protein
MRPKGSYCGKQTLATLAGLPPQGASRLSRLSSAGSVQRRGSNSLGRREPSSRPARTNAAGLRRRHSGKKQAVDRPVVDCFNSIEPVPGADVDAVPIVRARIDVVGIGGAQSATHD